MRRLACMTLWSVLAISAGAQSMTEFGAAAAGGSVGGAAGKKVSEGITAVFGKVDQQAKAAAKEDPAKTETPAAISSSAISSASAPIVSGPARSAPARVAAPAARPAPSKRTPAATSRKRVQPASVPDPPALSSHLADTKTPEPAPPPQPLVEVAAMILPPPAPPEVTADTLRSIVPGATRGDVLKLGTPGLRLTMFGDEGHLLEIYSYMTEGATFGVVRLSDGSVSKVELR
jgi:hypothetical protein